MSNTTTEFQRLDLVSTLDGLADPFYGIVLAVRGDYLTIKRNDGPHGATKIEDYDADRFYVVSRKETSA